MLVEPEIKPMQTGTNPIIKVDNLSKKYGRFTAVDGVSFQVTSGSIYGFVGPNGAGKTTTIKILATLLDPDDGQVSIGGYDLVTKPQKVRDILGYMPDYFGVYDDLTVTEYLEFYAHSQGVKSPGRSRLVADLLDLVDLGNKRNDFVNVLSRGMKQRLCLARCLVHNPQVLLLDEPASGLDPHARVEIRQILRELQNMGKTILVSSHILTELAELCTEIGIVDKGKFLTSGTMSEIQRRFGRKHLLRVRLVQPITREVKLDAISFDNFDQVLLPPEWLEGVQIMPSTTSLSGSLPNQHLTSVEDLERAAKILQVQPGLATGAQVEVDVAQNLLSVDFPGSDLQLNQALAALLKAAVPVCSFTIEQSALEDIFLDITAA